MIIVTPPIPGWCIPHHGLDSKNKAEGIVPHYC
jgi:hypothetical protein